MSRPAARALPGLTAALCAVLAASFALGVRLTDVAAHAQHQPAFTHALPFAVVDSSFAPPLRVQLALIAVGAVQSAVLLLLFRVLRARAVGRLERAVLIAAGVTMLAVALGAPAMSGFDAYAYAGYAKLGWPAAYAPPDGRFAPPFDVVNHVWGAP
ncbi:MAG: hypothetical protein JOZ24_00795, partial [Candidatus Eremiobacteraeota bacterium]|nr:hypothetical protein [Candidatus Eremiobacteraeota bacterium]